MDMDDSKEDINDDDTDNGDDGGGVIVVVFTFSVDSTHCLTHLLQSIKK